jgi:hypothetical protein
MTEVQFDPKRQELEELLPFYAIGMTTPEETATLEKALAADPALARSLALVREDMDAAVALNEAAGAPSARAFEKLAAAMEAEPRRPTVAARASQGLMGWVEATLASLQPRRLAYAGVAAALLIALQAAVLGGMFLRETGGGSFQTASRGDQAVSQPGAYALVSFAPAVTAGDLTAFLQRHAATIVDGPRAGGLFRLRVGSATTTEAELAAIVARMQAETAVVRFAQPSR